MSDEIDAGAGESSNARWRSGTAARLAGVPAATLRVWERRYGVVAAPKTVTGQRLYSTLDVQRLRLIKRLTSSGHAIGSIARLSTDELNALAKGLPSPVDWGIGRGEAAERRIVVVGRAAVRRLTGAGDVGTLEVNDDLSGAASRSGDADVLLVHVESLQPDAAERVLEVAARRNARTVVVTYAFATDAVVAYLRSAGVTLLREPVAGDDISRLLAASTASSGSAFDERPAAPRRFTDEALVAISQSATALSCECLRHICELALQVAAFETYSAECVARNPKDARQHLRLKQLAGTTRARFERAIVDLAAHESVSLG